MQFGLSSEQTLLKDSVDHYVRERSSLQRVRQFAANDEGRASDLLVGLAELGVCGLLIPEQYGGVGLSPLDACLVAESLGYHVAPVAFTASAAMVPTALLLAGSDAQRSAWLPKLAAGRMLVGAALSELCGARAGAGVSAKLTATGSQLSGRALHVLDFEADAYLVADSGCGLHWVAVDAPGLTRQRLESVDRTRPIGELVFNQVMAQPLPGGGASTCQRILDLGRLMLAADTLGAAQSMVDQAVAYAGQREQFGRVIGSFQAVKHMCAEMAAGLEPCRAFVWYAAHAITDTPAESHLLACQLKAHISEVSRFVAKTATEVHGGMGFTDLLGLHYWFKRIGMNRQLLGTPERLRLDAARAQGLMA